MNYSWDRNRENSKMSPNKIGTCEVCEKADIPVELHYGNMWFCPECWRREVESTKTHQSPEAQQARVDALIQSQRNPITDALRTSKEVDATIQVRTDLFNAATVAIIDIKKSIDENIEITNKPYALAEALKERFEHHRNVVFELQQQVVEATNHQRAIQTYLNNMANQLRAEEREKLHLQDINYKPAPVKIPTVKTVTTKQTSKKTKIDKTELREAAKRLGIAEFNFQMICISKGIGVSEAELILKKSIEAAKKESASPVQTNLSETNPSETTDGLVSDNMDELGK